MTVQVVDAPEVTLVGLQAAETRVAAIRVKVAVWEEPLRLAVMAAECGTQFDRVVFDAFKAVLPAVIDMWHNPPLAERKAV